MEAGNVSQSLNPQVGVSPANSAAVKIQSAFRGYLLRKSLFTTSEFPIFNELCEKLIAEPDCMPEVKAGHSRVYLPENHQKIIIKKSADVSPDIRLRDMQKVRSELKKQKSTHLVIPKAMLCKGFLIEERMQINNCDYFNMGMYLDNLNAFDKVVVEMANLFSVIYLGDLVSLQVHPLGHLDNVMNKVRYDNLPFILKSNHENENVAFIALIDLEHMKSVEEMLEYDSFCGRKPIETYTRVYSDLIRIFPYHRKVIENEINRLNLPYNKEVFDKQEVIGKQFLKRRYSDHLDYLKEKNISFDLTTWKFTIDESMIIELIWILDNKLLNLNNNIWDQTREFGFPIINLQGFLKGNENEVKTASVNLANILGPIIIKNIVINLKSYIASMADQHTSDVSEAEMISLRSVSLNRESFFAGINEAIQESTLVKTRLSRQFIEQIVTVCFDHLVAKGVLHFYDPCYYNGFGDAWIRF